MTNEEILAELVADKRYTKARRRRGVQGLIHHLENLRLSAEHDACNCANDLQQHEASITEMEVIELVQMLLRNYRDMKKEP